MGETPIYYRTTGKEYNNDKVRELFVHGVVHQRNMTPSSILYIKKINDVDYRVQRLSIKYPDLKIEEHCTDTSIDGLLSVILSYKSEEETPILLVDNAMKSHFEGVTNKQKLRLEKI